MKGIRILGRSFRDSFKSVVRNFSLSIASILCVTITLLLVSVALIIGSNINHTTKNIENELEIVVYMKSDATEEEVSQAEKEIKSLEKVSNVTFKSKNEWKEEVSSDSEEYKTVLDYLDENPLPDSFLVKVKDVNDLSKVAEYLKTINKVEVVKYGEGMIEGLISAFDIIQKVTIIIVLSLILVTAFLISNTIKLTIFSRRNEIEIMRLVGASNITIKMPFVFEGLFLGILGSIIPICITIYGYVILFTRLNGYVYSNLISLINPYNFVFEVSLILLIIGSLVGMFGSLKAVRKYLKI